MRKCTNIFTRYEVVVSQILAPDPPEFPNKWGIFFSFFISVWEDEYSGKNDSDFHLRIRTQSGWKLTMDANVLEWPKRRVQGMVGRIARIEPSVFHLGIRTLSSRTAFECFINHFWCRIVAAEEHARLSQLNLNLFLDYRRVYRGTLCRP
jgi:hypothetical protein